MPDLPRIVAFRNVLIHGYADVDDRVVWGVIDASLVALQEALNLLLEFDEITADKFPRP
ncbi:MAG: DUF86 domain-containing protein [Rhodoferax sp.]|nr:DUF86 domain-containing protein [Rhodoferax sp.]